MFTGNTQLDRKFRGDSKHPNQNLATNQGTCDQCGNGLIIYNSDRSESRCQVCNTTL
jgi:ribosomal protein S27E